MRNFLLFILACAEVMIMLSSCDKRGSDFIEPPHEQNSEVVENADYTKKDGVIRLVSYNVGIFSKYKDSITMIAAMMNELQADAVCLNELDSCTTRTGKVNQSKLLAQRMGDWHHFFAGAMPYKGGAYGEGMVVSPKYRNEGTYALKIPQGSGAEPRVCAVFKTEKFIFLATHLDHVNESARIDGADRICKWAKDNYGDSDIPVFLCGDMNCEPNDAPLLRLKQDWKLLSVTKNTYPIGPAKYPSKCIDFILALKNKAQYEVVGSDVPMAFKTGSVKEASDHLPIYVDVIL